MAKRVKAKAKKMWAIVSKKSGDVLLTYSAREDARQHVYEDESIEQVMVTPLKAKS